MITFPATLPAPIAAIARHLPEAPPATVLALALNTAAKLGYLSFDDFAILRYKRLRIEADDLGAGVTLTLGAGGFAATSAPADAVIRASLRDYARLALRVEDPDTLFFTRKLVIEGDTDLGLSVKNALDALDWDRLPAPLRWALKVFGCGGLR